MLTLLRNFIRSLSRRKADDEHVITGIPGLAKPILLFSENAALKSILEDVPTWTVEHVATLEEFKTANSEESYSMLISMSPPDEAGAALTAISEFKEKNPGALTVYHGWSYNVKESGKHALSAGADVLLVSGVLVHELIFLLGSALHLKARHVMTPSQEIYEALLRRTCPNSGFWKFQNCDLPALDLY